MQRDVAERLVAAMTDLDKVWNDILLILNDIQDLDERKAMRRTLVGLVDEAYDKLGHVAVTQVSGPPTRRRQRLERRRSLSALTIDEQTA